MNLKKIVISILALFAIAAALYGLWQWQQKANAEPFRQEQEIR